jgi:FlaA1/EpsC-like NDP-sugar epimerase
MGEPELIIDLAREMISRAGLAEQTADNPKGDIAITFTKPRPGEKLFEELSYDNQLENTVHEMIRKSNDRTHDLEKIKVLVELLENSVENRDEDKMLEIVCQAVPEYEPSEELRPNSFTHIKSVPFEESSPLEAN